MFFSSMLYDNFAQLTVMLFQNIPLPDPTPVYFHSRMLCKQEWQSFLLCNLEYLYTFPKLVRNKQLQCQIWIVQHSSFLLPLESFRKLMNVSSLFVPA